jgi:glycosyltransferase involved in cell wall biosynthesis
LVPPNDAEVLHHAMARLATDAELRSRLGNAARAAIVARDLTWEGNARRVVEAVRPLLVRMAGQRPSA